MVNLEAQTTQIDEDAADITDFCVNYGAASTSLSLDVVAPTDPATDINWNASLIGWFIDTNGDGGGEFFVSGKLESGGMVGSVEDRSSTPASDVCDATFSYANGTFTLAFANTCIGSPESLSVNPGYIYDQRIGDEDGVAVFDDAPNGDGAFEGPVTQSPDLGVVRYAGGERIATAVAVAQARFGDGEADTVVLARQDLFPDALAGTPLAISLDAPILLTETDSLSALTEAEIARLTGGEEGTIVLLGGTEAISEDVELALTGAGYTVVRHGGSNRFETAVAIAGALGSPATIFAADGGTHTYPLMAGTAAPQVDGAVLLTDGSTVPPATQEYLDATGSDVTAIGSAAAAALPDADSIAAADPIATAVDVAEAYFPTASVVGIARVDEFPDALAGGAYVGSDAVGPGPMLFVETDTLSDTVADYITAQAPDAAVIFGGVVAVSQDVEDAIAALL